MNGERVLRGAVCEVAGDAGRIEVAGYEAGRKQGADFAGEHDPLGQPGDVQRLDAQGIARQ